MRNSFKTHIEVTRMDICDLMLACTSAQYRANDGGQKWIKLREKLKAQLDELDSQIDEIIEFHDRVHNN